MVAERRNCDLNETDMVSAYREWPAPPSAGPIRCRWVQHVGSGCGGHVQRVLPDGCADVIVTDPGEAIVVGPATAAALAPLRPGTVLRGVRLRTEAARAVFGLPISELRDQTVPLADVFPASAAREVAETIWIGQFPTWSAPVVVDGRVEVAVRRLWRSPRVDVAKVASEVGLSGRQLRRLLLSETGLGPKTLQRVGRLHHFLHLAERMSPAGNLRKLAALAADAGYADQAHLTREVHDLSGLTPVRLLASRLE